MNIIGKKITVLGAARSGIAVAEMLNKKGAIVFVSDQTPLENISGDVSILNNNIIEYEFGSHSKRIFDCEYMVLSPGIPFASDIVQQFVQRDIPVYSEVEAAWWFCQSPLIAVTGSNGKTTTTTLIGEILKRHNEKSIVAGNIGQAFSEYVIESEKSVWGVIELSSFQLETIDTFKPRVAVVLNFAPNHLDRYNSYEDYLKAKWRITKNLTPDEVLIYNGDDQKLAEWAELSQAKKYSFKVDKSNPEGAALIKDEIQLFGERFISTEEIQLKGAHNYMNIMAALLAVKQTGIDNELIKSVLKTFSGVEHRLEKVAEVNNVLFINDSKATTIESLGVALQSFDAPIVLIAGGKDKGSDFTKLNKLIEQNVKEIFLIGTASGKMYAAWQSIKPIHVEKSLKDAVKNAQKIAKKGEVVMLSPACASFDMFKDYEDRGKKFKEIVHSLN